MIAGAQFRGQFEKRFKAALKEAVESEGRIVLFIDELHTVLGAGAHRGRAWTPPTSSSRCWRAASCA